jgi:hypothetical protein
LVKGGGTSRIEVGLQYTVECGQRKLEGDGRSVPLPITKERFIKGEVKSRKKIVVA